MELCWFTSLVGQSSVSIPTHKAHTQQTEGIGLPTSLHDSGLYFPRLHLHSNQQIILLHSALAGSVNLQEARSQNPGIDEGGLKQGSGKTDAAPPFFLGSKVGGGTHDSDVERATTSECNSYKTVPVPNRMDIAHKVVLDLLTNRLHASIAKSFPPSVPFQDFTTKI